ncbi:MAG: hypothetical protein JWQ16_1885 [Novosphingobium sp.]|nr:hypothetical protein [Novosphingobium sp.]
MTADLLTRGLIIETKQLERRPGRPRIDLEINASGGIVVGVSLAGANLVVARFVDLSGRALFTYEAKLAPSETLEVFVETIADCIAAAIDVSPFQTAELTRIGLALPGLVDTARGTLHFVTTFTGDPVPAAEILSTRLNLPVTIENDQACMARAIHWFGPAETLDTFSLIYIGYAVTTAEYADGLPKSGANGLNSELGHVKTAFGEEARKCFCGGRGCLTAYSSVYGILQHANLLRGVDFPSFAKMDQQFAELLDRAELGFNEANAALDQAADHLGIAIANHLTATDPGHVLISIPSERFIRRIEPRFWAVLRENAFPGVLRASEVRFIVTDQAWRHSGTAALALEQTYLGKNGT